VRESIGIIGFGNMGSAIGEQLKSRYKIWVNDLDKNKTNNLTEINIADNITDLVSKVGTIILAIKPQDFDIVLNEIKDNTKGKLAVSIAAGITTKYIENRLGETRVVRVMPNLPAKVSKGMICLCKGKLADKEDLNFVEEVFSYLGRTLILNEEMMDAATAVSGSGPGYFFDLIQDKKQEEWEVYARNTFIPALSASAQQIGFTTEQSGVLAVATAEGSIALLRATGLTPQALCIQVTSKGGTTAAGLEELHKTNSLSAAVKAAKKRAEELSGKE